MKVKKGNLSDLKARWVDELPPPVGRGYKSKFPNRTAKQFSLWAARRGIHILAGASIIPEGNRFIWEASQSCERHLNQLPNRR